jgi:hypothetical protein
MLFFRKKEKRGHGFVHNEEHDSDPRNLCYDEFAAGDYVNIPSEGNVANFKPRVTLNQNRTSSCTCHAVAHISHQTNGVLPSPRHLYWRIKTDPKYPSSNLDYGAYLRDSMNAMIDDGGADYNLAPNDDSHKEELYIGNFNETLKIRKSAEKNKGGAYVYATRSRNRAEIFDAIIKYMYEQKRPVQIGMRWYKEYNGYRKHGIVPARWAKGRWSGHAMAAVAWKKIDGHVYIGCMNSWGEYWGDKGMIWLPKTYAQIHTALSYLPPHKVKENKVEIPKKVKKRNLYKERANAQELREMIEATFPDKGTADAKRRNAVARGVAGTKWLVIVPAVCYRGYTFKDVINHLWAQSRDMEDELAYNIDFNKNREEEIK